MSCAGSPQFTGHGICPLSWFLGFSQAAGRSPRRASLSPALPLHVCVGDCTTFGLQHFGILLKSASAGKFSQERRAFYFKLISGWGAAFMGLFFLVQPDCCKGMALRGGIWGAQVYSAGRDPAHVEDITEMELNHDRVTIITWWCSEPMSHADFLLL